MHLLFMCVVFSFSFLLLMTGVGGQGVEQDLHTEESACLCCVWLLVKPHTITTLRSAGTFQT